jgi:hypothetical protein
VGCPQGDGVVDNLGVAGAFRAFRRGRPIDWSWDAPLGVAGLLEWRGCWSGGAAGVAGLLEWRGCWSGEAAGVARLLEWRGCWSGEAAGVARLLEWRGRRSGEAAGVARPPEWRGLHGGSPVSAAAARRTSASLAGPPFWHRTPAKSTDLGEERGEPGPHQIGQAQRAAQESRAQQRPQEPLEARAQPRRSAAQQKRHVAELVPQVPLRHRRLVRALDHLRARHRLQQ